MLWNSATDVDDSGVELGEGGAGVDSDRGVFELDGCRVTYDGLGFGGTYQSVVLSADCMLTAEYAALPAGPRPDVRRYN